MWTMRQHLMWCEWPYSARTRSRALRTNCPFPCPFFDTVATATQLSVCSHDNHIAADTSLCDFPTDFPIMNKKNVLFLQLALKSEVIINSTCAYVLKMFVQRLFWNYWWSLYPFYSLCTWEKVDHFAGPISTLCPYVCLPDRPNSSRDSALEII